MGKRKRRWWPKKDRVELACAQNGRTTKGRRSLDDLPNELVVAVVAELWLSAPEAFLAFGRTSKRARPLASEALRASWTRTWQPGNTAAACGEAALVCAALRASVAPLQSIVSVALLSRNTAKQLASVLLECEQMIPQISIAHEADPNRLSFWALHFLDTAVFDVTAPLLHSFRPLPGSEALGDQAMDGPVLRNFATCMRSALGRVVLVFAKRSVQVFAPTRAGLFRALFLWNEGGAGDRLVLRLPEPERIVTIAVCDWTHALSLLRESARRENWNVKLMLDASGLAIILSCDGETVFRYDLSRASAHGLEHCRTASFSLENLWKIGLAFRTFSVLRLDFKRRETLTARSTTSAGVCLMAALCSVHE
ncbi:Hypothetical protein UVM_LOCUS61 [uncultured virus]|nr:Hypothetical protein UVM_LOCUS61 [uncultured virus]